MRTTMTEERLFTVAHNIVMKPKKRPTKKTKNKNHHMTNPRMKIPPLMHKRKNSTQKRCDQ